MWPLKKRESIKDIANEVAKPALCEHNLIPEQCPVCAKKMMPMEEMPPMPSAPFPHEVVEIEDRMNFGSESRPRFAPLFVKVDRYKEIIEDMNALKGVLSNTIELIEVRKGIEQLKADTDAVIDQHLESLSHFLSELDKEFVRPPGSEAFIKERRPQPIEQHIEEAQREIKRLQEQLRGIK